ncbi:toprim domain-containing protein [Candidatus Roizmanbacteria bacterium]|nr:toprim domain-containing protein [Candidatus Roizmanbacteria bacterium]
MSLIVVESPTKARTFNRILKGEDYYVFATLGHIRDLPTKKISIDLEHDFKPSYEIIAKKRRVVEQLKKLSEKNNEIILATDPDREGESISYHVAQILGFFKEKWPEIKPVPKDLRLRRIIFHEITPKALHEALKKSESIRLDLVKAQQARRILDRIVGYQLSPLLWTKLGKNWLSAGRVQTVALRFIVEREKEIAAFSEEKYFQLYGQFKNSEELRAKLIQKNGEAYEKIYILKLFATEYRYTKTSINEKNLSTLCKDIEGDSHKVHHFPTPTGSNQPVWV